MQHITKQTHYVRCLALELLYSSLCDPQAEMFGDPCSLTSITLQSRIIFLVKSLKVNTWNSTFHFQRTLINQHIGDTGLVWSDVRCGKAFALRMVTSLSNDDITKPSLLHFEK